MISYPLTTLVMTLLLVGVAEPNQALQSPHQAFQSPPRQISVLRAVAPVYPPIAATAGASGTVVIEVQADPRGNVTSARAVEGLKILGRAAEDSARRWVFAPVDGKTDIRVARLTFTFKLMPDDADPSELVPIFMPPYQVEVRRATPRVADNPNVDPLIFNQPSRPRKRKN